MTGMALPDPLIQAIVQHHAMQDRPTDYPTLRASEIGDECARKLWYRLNWAGKPKQFDGRMIRLFETGNREETRVIAELEAIGVEVTDSQKAITPMLGGWLTGHIDGKASSVPGAEKTHYLLEVKTHNDKSWQQWRKMGVRLAKPQHFAQMQIYMHQEGLQRGLYIAHNKDTDQIECQRIEYDPVTALALVAKAERILHDEHAPSRLSDKPDWFVCKMCEFYGICHQGEFARSHCRTCLHSRGDVKHSAPAMECGRDGHRLDVPAQRKGCQHHLYAPDFVAGRQIDADEAAETITYQMRDGSFWTDGKDAIP